MAKTRKYEYRIETNGGLSSFDFVAKADIVLSHADMTNGFCVCFNIDNLISEEVEYKKNEKMKDKITNELICFNEQSESRESTKSFLFNAMMIILGILYCISIALCIYSMLY